MTVKWGEMKWNSWNSVKLDRENQQKDLLNSMKSQSLWTKKVSDLEIFSVTVSHRPTHRPDRRQEHWLLYEWVHTYHLIWIPTMDRPVSSPVSWVCTTVGRKLLGDSVAMRLEPLWNCRVFMTPKAPLLYLFFWLDDKRGQVGKTSLIHSQTQRLPLLDSVTLTDSQVWLWYVFLYWQPCW
jgi:hypothetical protein